MRAAHEDPVLRAVDLGMTYEAQGSAEKGLRLFAGLHLEVRAGEMVAIIGRSGAGKSSLLHLLAGLERPSEGKVWIGEEALHSLNARQTSQLRNRRIGYVWQFHYLLPEFSAWENVALPLLARGTPKGEARRCAMQWLERVGLSGRADHRSGELSGGEQQRVAIARALVTEPALLLADEPTGDLDGETAGLLLALLKELCAEYRLAAVLVTHNQDIARSCDRVLELVNGKLQHVT